MGVAGLWSLLEDSGKTRSLAAFALEAFDSENKAFRLGIDASIWFFHAEYGKEGENPELRTLFFRCAQLLRAPILPLFIFDGPKRPEFKRGKKINRSANKLTTGMKKIIEAYGFQHHTAPGEAEAELALLNSMGIIDGVLTDDVDTYLFGASTILRNPSSTHAQAKNDKKKSFVRVYRDITLSRADLILIGLCSGGDYNQAGLPNCGVKTSLGLAKSGLSQTLFDAAVNLPRDELPTFLSRWREDVVKELATDASGHIGRKNVALSRSVPKSFPDVSILLSYIEPITSFSEGRPEFYYPIVRDWKRKEPSLPDIAATCEFFFEWGFKESIVKRSRTVLWEGVAFRVLRRYLLDGKIDGLPTLFAGGKPIPQHGTFMRRIHSSRRHYTTDDTLEYRVEIDPTVLVQLVEAGVQGNRRPDDHVWSGDEDSDAHEAQKVDPNAPLRVWLPAELVRKACPDVTSEYDERELKKKERKKPKGTRKKKAAVLEELSDEEEPHVRAAVHLDVPKTGMHDFFQAKKTVAAVATKTKKTTNTNAAACSSRSSHKMLASSSEISPSKVLSALNVLETPKKAKAKKQDTTSRRAAMPFPFHLSPLRDATDIEDESGFDSDVQILPPMTPSPKKKTPRRRHSSQTSSPSDEDERPSNKSPRRSRLDGPSSKDKARREASPLAGRISTPLRRKAPPLTTKTIPVESVDVIIISSSEDEDVPTMKPQAKAIPKPNRRPVPVKSKAKAQSRPLGADEFPLMRARALGV